MIPTSGIPAFSSLARKFPRLWDLFDRCSTPNAFFSTVRRNKVDEEEKQCLGQFIYGFLLYNSQENPNVHRIVNDHYMTINGATGENFILWTSVSPGNEEILKTVKTEDAQAWAEKYEEYDGLFSSICHGLLGVRDEGKPILVLSEWLTSSKILVVDLDDEEISKNKLEDLFRSISRSFEECPRSYLKDKSRKIHDDARVKVKDAVELMGFACCEMTIKNAEGSSQSFATAMEGAYSFVMGNPEFQKSLANVKQRDLEMAYKTAECFVNSAREAIDNLKAKIDRVDPNSTEYIEWMEKYSELCSQSLTYSIAQYDSRMDIRVNPVGCEWLSRIDDFLYEKGGSKKYFTLAKKAFLLREFLSEDVSPIGICFAKVFENEINTSVVQKIRQDLGIPMPDNFNKLYDGEGDFTKGDVDFNKRIVKKEEVFWLPPELGRSLNAFEKMRIELKFEQTDSERHEDERLPINKFKSAWGCINAARNTCAHAGHLEEQSAALEKILDNFKIMLDNGFWKTLKNVRDEVLTEKFVAKEEHQEA